MPKNMVFRKVPKNSTGLLIVMQFVEDSTKPLNSIKKLEEFVTFRLALSRQFQKLNQIVLQNISFSFFGLLINLGSIQGGFSRRGRRGHGPIVIDYRGWGRRGFFLSNADNILATT